MLSRPGSPVHGGPGRRLPRVTVEGIAVVKDARPRSGGEVVSQPARRTQPSGVFHCVLRNDNSVYVTFCEQTHEYCSFHKNHRFLMRNVVSSTGSRRGARAEATPLDTRGRHS